MPILNTIIVIGLVLLSLASGVPKMLRMPQEVAFLQGIGFSELMVVMLGMLQVIGGALLIMPGTRFVGSILLAVTLFISTIAIFVGGHTSFALVSILPIIMTCVVMFDSYNARNPDSANRR